VRPWDPSFPFYILFSIILFFETLFSLFILLSYNCQRLPISSTSFSKIAYFKMTDANQNGNPQKKTYHKKATGNALITAKAHAKEEEIKLYGSCFWSVSLPSSSPSTHLPHLHTHPYPLQSADISQPLRPKNLDIPRTQIPPLPIHRNRPLLQAPLPPIPQPSRPRPNLTTRSRLLNLRIHCHHGVSRGLGL